MTVLRSALYNLFFFGVSSVLAVYGMALRLLAPHRIIDLARLWARLMLGGARVICGIRVQVTGLDRLPDGAALLASRHQSAFDTLVWLLLAPRCCYVLKQELLRIPVFGWLVPPTGMIAVDRSGGSAALRGLMRDGAQAARDGRQIVIFPEGTRAAPGAVLPLQPGIAALAASTGLPVIPVVTDSGLYWGRRAFRKRPGTIHIVLLPALPAGLPRPELMRRLTEALRSEIRPARASDYPSSSG
ncbi:MAG TPA: lysophospholipid acyltransferase family protein [Acetobacteraceae bacterium]|nr:lysophospholipid acyltransferase family protein [Acetobacteraceae bacterium]